MAKINHKPVEKTNDKRVIRTSHVHIITEVAEELIARLDAERASPSPYEDRDEEIKALKWRADIEMRATAHWIDQYSSAMHYAVEGDIINQNLRKRIKELQAELELLKNLSIYQTHIAGWFKQLSFTNGEWVADDWEMPTDEPIAPFHLIDSEQCIFLFIKLGWLAIKNKRARTRTGNIRYELSLTDEGREASKYYLELLEAENKKDAKNG